MYKKLIAIVGVVLLAALVAACAKQTGPSPSGAEASPSATGSSPSATGSSPSGTEASPSGEKVTITGTVTDATMHTVTIQTDDDKELTFSTADGQVQMKAGLLLGDVVLVGYTGDIKENDATAVTVLYVTDGADNSKNPLRIASDKPVDENPADATGPAS